MNRLRSLTTISSRHHPERSRSLVSREEELRNYRQRYKVFLWWGTFQAAFAAAQPFPQMLKALADFSVPNTRYLLLLQSEPSH